MITMITKEEFEKAVEYCTGFAVSCEYCPLCKKDFKCGAYLAAYLAEYLKENEIAPAATGTTKDTNSTHLDDSTTLIDICQAGIEEMAKIALDDYPNDFLTGYVEAFKHNIERLKGGDCK